MVDRGAHNAFVAGSIPAPATRRLPRIAILVAAQRSRCAYCEEPFGLAVREANPTIDHIVPRPLGGDRSTIENQCAACARCNSEKGSMSAEEFRALIARGGLRKRTMVFRKRSRFTSRKV